MSVDAEGPVNVAEAIETGSNATWLKVKVRTQPKATANPTPAPNTQRRPDPVLPRHDKRDYGGDKTQSKPAPFRQAECVEQVDIAPPRRHPKPCKPVPDRRQIPVKAHLRHNRENQPRND